MELRATTQLSVLLVITLIFCHGVFGAVHLLCYPPQCAGGAEHPAEYRAAAGAGDAHEHPAGHETSIEYFAVLVGLLGLLLRLLPKIELSRGGLTTPRVEALRRLPVVFHLPPPKPPNLQVFTLSMTACGGAGGGQQSSESGGDGEDGSAKEAGMDHDQMGRGMMGMGSGGMAKQMVMENGKYSDERFIDRWFPTTSRP